MSKTQNKIIFLLAGLCFLILTFTFIYGCGGSSGGGGISQIIKLYIAGRSNEIMVFNLEAFTQEASIFISGAVNIRGIAISNDKKILYVVDNDDSNRKIYSYNLGSSALDEIDLSSYDKLDFYTAVSSDGNFVFATPGSQAGVFAFKTSPFSLQKLATTEISNHISCFGIATKGDFAYIAEASNALTKGHILKYSISSQTIVASVEIPEGGVAWFIRFNNNGNKIYVPAKNADKVFMLDVNSFSFDGASITVESWPSDIGFTSGNKAYVANYGDNSISVINTANNSLVKTINLEGFPKPSSLVVDESRQRVYVNASQSPILSVIDMVTDTLVSTCELSSDMDQIAVKSLQNEKFIPATMAF